MPKDAAPPDHLFEQVRAWLGRQAAVLLDDRLRGKVDPSDIVQDTLLKAFEKREQLRGRTEAERRASLRKILANTLVDVVRQFLVGRKRNIGLERSLEDALQQSSEHLRLRLADGQAVPDQETENQERLLWLAEGLSQLPGDQRQAVRLKHLHGLSVGAIAREMGKSPAAVAGLLRRGLEGLRQRPGEPPD
jgi:RNA polymerase sigma-70 factor (ECF subfamily)